MSIIIYGEQGSGKSINAEKLRAFFGVTTIIDPWTPDEPLPEDAIAFTNEPCPGAIHIDGVLRKLKLSQHSEAR